MRRRNRTLASNCRTCGRVTLNGHYCGEHADEQKYFEAMRRELAEMDTNPRRLIQHLTITPHEPADAEREEEANG